MMTHKQRILMAARGEMPDILPYAPRIDLWYNANSLSGTLPEKHKGRTQDEISRAEGWALHKIIPKYLKVRSPADNLHRAIGVFSSKETQFSYQFPSDIEIKVNREADSIHVEYHTPIGKVSTTTVYTEEMRKAGASITWVKEHVIKKPEDYPVVEYIFNNLKLTPDFDDYITWKDGIGEDGVAVAMGEMAASPMHHILKYFVDTTTFYYHYRDYPKEMRALAEAVKNYFNQALDIASSSPAEAVVWGANFDDMITYPSFSKKRYRLGSRRQQIPWAQKERW